MPVSSLYLFKSLQYILCYLFRVLVRDGLFVEFGHPRARVSHLLYYVRGFSDLMGFQDFSAKTYLRGQQYFPRQGDIPHNVP